jgi:hypothetical protein
MLYPGHRGTNYRVYMLDNHLRERTLCVVSTIEAADAAVDRYSDKYPNAHVDYTNCL